MSFRAKTIRWAGLIADTIMLLCFVTLMLSGFGEQQYIGIFMYLTAYFFNQIIWTVTLSQVGISLMVSLLKIGHAVFFMAVAIFLLIGNSGSLNEMGISINSYRIIFPSLGYICSFLDLGYMGILFFNLKDKKVNYCHIVPRLVIYVSILLTSFIEKYAFIQPIIVITAFTADVFFFLTLKEEYLVDRQKASSIDLVD